MLSIITLGVGFEMNLFYRYIDMKEIHLLYIRFKEVFETGALVNIREIRITNRNIKVCGIPQTWF